MHDVAACLNHWALTHKVPGAQLAIAQTAGVEVQCYGLANTATQQHVTARTRFQIGSVTKPMLAFVAFRLSEAGVLDIDAPPHAYLKALPQGAPLASDELTVRCLMNHSSGLPGDLFLDLGDGFDASSKLLSTTGDVPPLHRAGAEASYCNFAYVALGEIISAVTGAHWPSAFNAHVRCVLDSDTLDPWPGVADAQAIGHAHGEPVSRANLAFSNAAAGTTPIGTAADLAWFGQLLLKSLNGDGPISVDSAKVMTELSAKLAPNERGLGFGQGLMVMDWGGVPVFGHDGLTIGQRAFLRVFPETGVSVGLLGNGGDLQGVYQDVFEDLAPITGAFPAPRLMSAESSAFDPGLCGRYDRPNASLLVSSDDGVPSLRILNHEPWAEHAYGAVEGPFPLKPCGAGQWMIEPPASSVPLMVSFGEGAVWHGMRRYNRAVDGLRP